MRSIIVSRVGMRTSMVCFCTLLFLSSVSAHHSFVAEFDQNVGVDIQGYVTKIEWFNPHVHFYLDVENDATGEIESWSVEMGPPHSLQNRGWKRNTMNIGDEVRVVGTRARNGSTLANARSVTMVATGQALLAASSESQVESSAEQDEPSEQ